MAATAQLHLLSRQGEAMWVSLGEKSSLLGYEVEDYSAEGFRFKDDPVQENYDWDAYWSRVAGALVIVGGVTLIAGTGAGILAAGGWAVNATVVMGSAAAGGIIAVGGLAAMDAMSGRLSSAQEYIREALVGSIIGALTGATAQLPTKRLGIVGKNVAEFAIGSGESAVEQQLRKGEIDFREAIGCGILNLILSGVLDNLSREQGVRVRGGEDLTGKGIAGIKSADELLATEKLRLQEPKGTAATGGLPQGREEGWEEILDRILRRSEGGEGRVIFFEDELPPEEAERLINFLKNGSTEGLTSAEREGIKKVDEALALKRINYQDIWDIQNSSKVIEGGSKADTKPYTNSRPSFRKGVVEEVWENAKGPDGLVRDPNTGEVINWTLGESRKGVWDMGHIPEAKYSEMHEAYMNGELTTKEFVDWYNDPANYRPELPSNNRSHKYE